MVDMNLRGGTQPEVVLNSFFLNSVYTFFKLWFQNDVAT